MYFQSNYNNKQLPTISNTCCVVLHKTVGKQFHFVLIYVENIKYFEHNVSTKLLSVKCWTDQSTTKIVALIPECQFFNFNRTLPKQHIIADLSFGCDFFFSSGFIWRTIDIRGYWKIIIVFFFKWVIFSGDDVRWEQIEGNSTRFIIIVMAKCL